MRRGPNQELRKTTKQPLNIIAMFNAVGSQEASSKPKPMAPRKSGSPTVSSRAFSVATPAPRKTPTIPSHGLVTNLDPPAGACGTDAVLAAALTANLSSLFAGLGTDSRYHGHPGAQP